MQKWKINQGPEATYKNLIKIFKHVGCELYADKVRDLVSKCCDQTNKSCESEDHQTSLPPSPPLPPQLPEFPESVTLAVNTVQLEKLELHQESNGESIIVIILLLNWYIL